MTQEISKPPAVSKEFIKGAIAFGIGAIVRFASAFAENWSDPQSAVTYWLIGYWILIICSGIFGIIFPDRPWRWALYLIATQFGMGILTLKGAPILLATGVVIHLIQALPFFLISYGGAWGSRIWKNRMTGKLTQEISKNPATFKEYIKVAIAVGIGVIVWTVFKVIAHPKDPTELLSYLQIGYPISILLSGAMGIFFSERSWRWGISIIWVQFGLGLITTKGDLNLLPLGILFYMVLTVPCIISGYIGAWVSRTWKNRMIGKRLL